jgi:hypothetical protein
MQGAAGQPAGPGGAGGGGTLPPTPPLPPAVVVHAAAQAEAALAAAGPRGVLLLSARGAGAFMGPAVFLRMVARAAALHPGVPHHAALDCADAPGFALAALRAGVPVVLLDRASPAWPAVAAAAAEAGAVLLAERPPALDLGPVNLRRPGGLALLARWLAAAR